MNLTPEAAQEIITALELIARKIEVGCAVVMLTGLGIAGVVLVCASFLLSENRKRTSDR